MKILFISNDLIGGNLAYLLSKEGHEVKLYIEEENRRNNFTNLVTKTADWKSELDWVGKDGLIIFDDVGYGFIQDSLRKDGYTVFGGSAVGDMLEQNRVFGQEIFSGCGMKILPTNNFNDIDSAIRFVQNNPFAWVIKQNGTSSKSLNYVGVFNDGRDVVDVLKTYKLNNANHSQVLTLQKKVTGIEIAITRYFNGKDWVGPMLINIEHKKFFPGDIGPTTSEMGTIGWYEEDENNKLFKETLEKIKPYLQSINYRGIFDINCIVNKDGAFPIEATSRLGSPIIHMQTELNLSSWPDPLLAIAKGEPFKLKHKTGFGIVIVITIPPFPYAKKIDEHSQIGTRVYFDDSMTEEEKSHIHYEEISWNKQEKYLYVSDDRGYVLYVTEHGQTIEEAEKKVYNLIRKIHIPKMMYRNDIGQRFIDHDREQLKNWGYYTPLKKRFWN